MSGVKREHRGGDMSYEIELTEAETELLNKIELDTSKLVAGQFEKQAPFMLELYKSLEDRGAIPEIRFKYWNDPDYRNGHAQLSHKGMFEQKGSQGEEIYTNPGFLEYLRYFLFGAQLREDAVAEFKVMIGDPVWSQRDRKLIATSTSKIVRKYDLSLCEEEFYRLALDMGLGKDAASLVRKTVKQLQ